MMDVGQKSYFIVIKPGVFKNLWVSNEIEMNVVEKDLWIQEGCKVWWI